MNKKQETIATYSRGAVKYAAKFNAIGPYKKDIKKAFSLIKKESPKVVELGCGNGKEAREILSYTNDYLGIDAAEGMIRLAKEQTPEANFLVANMEDWDYPKGVDIFFAFTSLLDLEKEEVRTVLEKIYQSLNPGGIFMLTLKYGKYRGGSKSDEYGTKYFYWYTPELIREMVINLKLIETENYLLLGEEWFKIIFQKTS